MGSRGPRGPKPSTPSTQAKAKEPEPEKEGAPAKKEESPTLLATIGGGIAAAVTLIAALATGETGTLFERMARNYPYPSIAGFALLSVASGLALWFAVAALK